MFSRKLSSASSLPGSEYKSKKAKGDIKKKGKLDPYAYLPLRRSNLNKRFLFISSFHIFFIVSLLQETFKKRWTIQKFG